MRVGWAARLLLAVFVLVVWSTVGFASKVVYFYNWYGSDSSEQVFLDLIEEFRELHPEIELELIRGGSVSDRGAADRLLSMIAAGTPPDVLHFERSTVIEYAAKGLLRPLEREFGTLEGEFVPGALQEVTYRGSVYGIPWGTDIRGLFWNKADFDEAGLDPQRGPASIEELDDMAQKLTRANSEGGYDRIGFVPWLGNWYSVGWLYTWGGDIFDPDNVKPRVNTPNHVRGFEWIQDYGQRYPHDVVSSMISGTTDTTFYGRKISMLPSWNGFVNLVRQADPTLEVWAGEVPHPAEGTNGTWMGGYTHVIPASARNVEGAITLLKFLTSKEAEVAWYRHTGSLPTRWSALAEIADELSPTDAILVQQTDVAWGRPPLWHPPFLTAVNAAQLSVARLEASPKDALDEAQRQLEITFREILGE